MKQKIIKKSVASLGKVIELLENIQKELSKRPSREDLKQELSNYPTKEEVKSMFQKNDYKLEDRLTKLRSDFYDKIDPFLREIEDNREDRVLTTSKLRKIDSTLILHDKRITKLENHKN